MVKRSTQLTRMLVPVAFALKHSQNLGGDTDAVKVFRGIGSIRDLERAQCRVFLKSIREHVECPEPVPVPLPEGSEVPETRDAAESAESEDAGGKQFRGKDKRSTLDLQIACFSASISSVMFSVISFALL